MHSRNNIGAKIAIDPRGSNSDTPHLDLRFGGVGMYPVYRLSRWMLSWLVLYLRLNRIEPTVR